MSLTIVCKWQNLNTKPVTRHLIHAYSLLTIKQNGVIMVKSNNAPINPQYIYTVRDWQRGEKHYSFEYMNILSEGVIFAI